jgi:hypothetical protein
MVLPIERLLLKQREKWQDQREMKTKEIRNKKTKQKLISKSLYLLHDPPTARPMGVNSLNKE